MSAVPVHAEVDGPLDAPALVLSCSLGSDLSMWEPQADALATDYRVVRYDHRGHGRSPVPSGPYTLDDLVDDVIALLDELGLARASFCGLSLGGMVGMRLAAREPVRVARLALCCTSADLAPAEAWHERAATVRANGVDAVAGAVVKRWLTPVFREREPGRTKRMQALIASTPAEGYAGCCEAIATMDLAADLPRIAAPTLVLAGADDPATPPAHAEAIAAAIPDASVRIIEDAAHLANVEQPEAVTAALAGHLRGVERRDR